MSLFHVVIWQSTSKNSIKVRVARLSSLIQAIRSLFSGVVVAIADRPCITMATAKTAPENNVSDWINEEK